MINKTNKLLFDKLSAVKNEQSKNRPLKKQCADELEIVYNIDTIKEVITYYNKEKTKIKSIQRYNLHGKLHGKTEGFYKSGKKHYELNYFDGKLHGTQFIYWVNLKPFIEFNFSDGKLEGPQIEYTLNGAIQSATIYTNAKNCEQNEDTERCEKKFIELSSKFKI